MTLKEQFLEELQKLRLSRERPYTPKTMKLKQSKRDKLFEEADKLLAQLAEEEG